MLKRKIYEDLLKWKENDKNIKPLMILGVRQCGKTYIIDKFCKNEYQNVVKINLFEDTEIIDLYKSNLNSEEKFLRLKAYLKFDIEKENTIFFIDEIQESEDLISELKFFCEKHNKIRIICAGSLLGIKLKKFKKSFPVGKVKMLNMYPMDFEEYLEAFKEENLIGLIKDCYKNNKSMGALHTKAIGLYRNYLVTGGMPEMVENALINNGDYVKYDLSIIEDIKKSYFNDMNKYVESESESLKIRKIYESLPSQLANLSKKFQYSKVEKNARSRDYESSLSWLKENNMIYVANKVKLPQIPLEGFKEPDIFKLYLSDVGILNNMLGLSIFEILNDDIGIYKGIIAENYVASELMSLGFSLYYWQSEYDSEVDFLINTIDGIIPIEVKDSDNTKSKSLNVYFEKFKPNYMLRISTKDFGYNEESKIKSIPLYAIFCLKNR